MHIKTKGLVIRETQIKEADKLLCVITSDRGKIIAKARGVLRKGSRISPACQLFCYSDFTLFEGKSTITVNEAEPICMFLGLRKSPARLALAAYIADILDNISDSDEQNPDILRLGLNMLYAAGELRAPLELVRSAFEARAVVLSGYEPDFSECAVCKNAEPKNTYFRVEAGDIVCGGCFEKSLFPDALPCPDPVFRALKHFASAPLKQLLNYRPDGLNIQILSDITERYIGAKLGCGFGALKFYKGLVQNG
jgi:DNA repair protein RecO (recombination protein O)